MMAFRTRVVEGMEEIVAAPPGQKVVVFCHGGVINVWATHVLAMQPRRQVKRT